MLTGLKVSSLHVNVYFTDENIIQNEDPMELNFKVLKCKNEIYQRIELEEQMRKMGSFNLYIQEMISC